MDRRRGWLSIGTWNYLLYLNDGHRAGGCVRKSNKLNGGLHTVLSARVWLQRCRVQERRWARVVDRREWCRERPPGENGRKPHEGRQHTASAFSSGWRRWVTAPRIEAVCLLHRAARGSGLGARGTALSAPRSELAIARAMPPLPARLHRDPAAGIVTTIRDTVSCSWIFYSECRTRNPFPSRIIYPNESTPNRA